MFRYLPAYSVRIEVVHMYFNNDITNISEYEINTCLALNAFRIFVCYTCIKISMQLVLASTFT